MADCKVASHRAANIYTVPGEQARGVSSLQRLRDHTFQFADRFRGISPARHRNYRPVEMIEITFSIA